MNGIELKGISLLAELDDDERELLAELLESETIHEGRVLFEQGVQGEGLVFLLEGEVALETREQGAMGKRGAGAALGALALVAPGRRESTALAASACSVAWMDRGTFHRLMEDAPRAACKLLEALLRETAGDLREGLPALRSALPSAPNDGPH